ncbi:MAG TPA: D-alanyl-D-alanine carboxypeptidase family protein [Patescibacteria group bacterium]|nr:D-alanyl-D-alanine carboxypeptidase family protein [Patescibacteria group bacterium]
MFKRILTLLCLAALAAPPLAAAAPAAPLVGAESACLMMAGSHRVIYGKKQDSIMYPASTTKIVTLLTALEKGKLDDVVTVSARAANTEGSSLDLSTGDQLTLRDLLYGMMMVSGNDAAEAVAEHVGGSASRFVDEMNQEAEKLGASRTHFSNPHGLPDPVNHFTTAYDMALITEGGFKNPEFARVVATRGQQIRLRNQGGSRYVENINRLLSSYPGANGVKTGFTNAAGYCLVASAKRNNVQLIAVIFNSDQRWEDASRLLDYGFRVLGGEE